MTQRAAAGSGTVFKDKHANRYIGQISIDGRRHRVYGRTKTDARTALNAIIKHGGTPPPNTARTTSTGQPLVNKGETLGALLDVWVKRDLEGRAIAPSTLAAHRWAVAHILGDPIAKRRGVDVTVRHLDDMFDRLVTTYDLSRASLRKVQSTLNQALEFAVRRGDMMRNVASHATLPPAAKRTQPRKALVPADACKLLAQLHKERNGLMFGLMLRIGLRPGEAMALHWADLHDGNLNITRGLQRVKGVNTIADELKTSASKRTIELPADVVEWMGQHRRTQASEHLSPLMFTTPTGGIIDPKKTRTDLAAICKTAKVPRVAPNELRHSCASLLADMGVMNESIADLLGHTTTRMVDTTYRHRLRPVVSIAVQADWTTADNGKG